MPISQSVEPPDINKQGSTTWPSGQVERRRSDDGGPNNGMDAPALNGITCAKVEVQATT